MTTTFQSDAPAIAREALPTMYDLPSEEIGEPGMPDEYHAHQAVLLHETFQPPAFAPDNFYSAIDMHLYYDLNNTGWYKRPDWFGVIGVSRLYAGHDLRLSYVIWQERVAPLIVVELLSPGTEREDLGQTTRATHEPPTKWEVYEHILQVPYYAVFSREADQLRFFKLSNAGYTEVSGHGGRCWLPEAGLGLGLWYGSYHGCERLWLRWYDAQDKWIPTLDERLEQERQQVEQERQRAEEERQRAEEEHQRAEEEHQRAEEEHQRAEEEHQRAERLAERLRQLGYDPEQL